MTREITPRHHCPERGPDGGSGTAIAVQHVRAIDRGRPEHHLGPGTAGEPVRAGYLLARVLGLRAPPAQGVAGQDGRLVPPLEFTGQLVAHVAGDVRGEPWLKLAGEDMQLGLEPTT